MTKKIILASKSKARYALLTTLGLDFEVIASNLDESLLKVSSKSPKDISLELAHQKALSISKIYPNSYVIGADQVCELDGQIFDKPGNSAKAFEHLKLLQGKSHKQHCSAVIYRDNTLLFEFSKSAILRMKKLKDQEIINYIDLDKPFDAAGSFHFENNGKELFESIDGDPNWIIGLPIIEIQEFFRGIK